MIKLVVGSTGEKRPAAMYARGYQTYLRGVETRPPKQTVIQNRRVRHNKHRRGH